MTFFKVTLLVTITAFFSVKLSWGHPGFHFGWGDHHGGISFGLSPQFYQFSCPQANEIVMSVLEKAIAKDMRIAASLLRLHFHDCFVQVNSYCISPKSPLQTITLTINKINLFRVLFHIKVMLCIIIELNISVKLTLQITTIICYHMKKNITYC